MFFTSFLGIIPLTRYTYLVLYSTTRRLKFLLSLITFPWIVMSDFVFSQFILTNEDPSSFNDATSDEDAIDICS